MFIKNKKMILVAVSAASLFSFNSKATSVSFERKGGSNYHIGLTSASVIDSVSLNGYTNSNPSINNLSPIISGFGVQIGYKFNFNNKFSIGTDLTYFYSSIYLKYSDNKEIPENEGVETGALSLCAQNINGHRINLDLVFTADLLENFSLFFAGTISYNPGRSWNRSDFKSLSKEIDSELKDMTGISFENLPAEALEQNNRIKLTDFMLNNKIINDFGFGIKFGSEIKLTKNISFNGSVGITVFSTTESYRNAIEPLRSSLEKDPIAKKMLETYRLDIVGLSTIRYNF